MSYFTGKEIAVSEHIELVISKQLFERLKAHAEPLVDTTETVIERLLDCWDAHKSEPAPLQNSYFKAKEAFWRSSRGDVLPIGMELQGTYMGKTFTARVEHGGIRLHETLYDNLSPAAIAVKNLAGKTGKAANTNGRDFWKFQNPITGQWVPVSTLRPSSRINVDELLAELDKTP